MIVLGETFEQRNNGAKGDKVLTPEIEREIMEELRKRRMEHLKAQARAWANRRPVIYI